MYSFYTKKLWAPPCALAKLLMIMRLTTLILITAILHVSASSYAQKITLSEKNAPLVSIFDKIRAQTGVDFLVSTSMLKEAKRVSIQVNNEDLPKVLDKIFEGQGLDYKINDKSVVVSRKEKSFLENLLERFQMIDVRGRVVDEKGDGILGATVSVKGKNQSVSSGTNGAFTLTNVDENAVLLISFVGYVTKEIKAKAEMGIITLILNNSPLDEVHVIAYGTTSKRLTTGNIGGIKAADIETQPVNNPLLALAGRVPGVLVLQNSGVAGSGVTVRIQGINSIGKGREPFYVVDGSPFVPQLLPTLQGNIQQRSGDDYFGKNTGSGNPFSYLNPSDIESIEVLKDADATAIYGSRAANGAILITTKRGNTGQTKVNLTVQNGIGQVGNEMDMLNTQQYLELRKEAYKNGNLTVPTPASAKTASNYDLTVWDQNKYTNWQKELIGGNANYTDVQVGLSGGTALTSFRLNAGYHKETTVFNGDFADNKGSFGVSLNHSSTNQKFKTQFSGNYLVDDNNLPQVDLTQVALQTAPNAPDLYNANGSLNWARIPSGSDSVSTWTNPSANLLNKYQIKAGNLISNLNLSYNIYKGIFLKTNLGYTSITTTEISISPLIAIKPESRSSTNRGARYGEGKIYSWIIEPQLTYNEAIGNGKMEILIGTTFQKNQNNLQQLNGSGYNSDATLVDFKSATTLTADQSMRNTYKYSALFARINYNWLDKYIVNFTARRDGSSRFGSENQFHNFGAIGAAWLFTNESFIKDNLAFLSFGKIRASYGTTGNDQIGDYAFLNQYEVVTANNPYQGINGLQVTAHTNPFLQWELTKKLQGGIDLGLLKDRILINVNYFKNRSSNQLIGYTLPITTGFDEVQRNFPATVENSGWEFSLTTTNLQHKSFSWSTNFNLTSGKNKLISFPNLATSTYYNSLFIGEPVNVIKLYNFAGVDSKTGVYQYYAADGTIVTSPNASTDQTERYRPLQNLFGGLQNNITYKGFQLDVFFQFVKQTARNYNTGISIRTGSMINQPVSVLDRWRDVGDVTNIQKYSTTLLTSTYAQLSNISYSDASYIRLKNLSFSWNLPENWSKAAHLDNCKLFIHGQNLITFTKYDGLDPETLSVISLPPLRVWTFGIQVSL